MRAKYCYLCGAKLASGSKIVQILLDRKDRDVHSRCALREIKRLKDNARR